MHGRPDPRRERPVQGPSARPGAGPVRAGLRGLAQRPAAALRVGIKHAALDPFRGYTNALRVSLPVAVQVLDAFHVARLGTSNGPTEAINGRLEHLRGSALGFRNLTNYIAGSLLETGGFRPRLHPRL